MHNVKRTQWTRDAPSDSIGGAISSKPRCTKDLDAIVFFCSQSSLLFVSPSAMHQEGRKPLGSSEARRLGIFPWARLQQQGLVRHLRGVRFLSLPFWGRHKRRAHGLCPEESSAGETHTYMGSEVLRQVRYIKTIHQMQQSPWCSRGILVSTVLEPFGQSTG